MPPLPSAANEGPDSTLGAEPDDQTGGGAGASQPAARTPQRTATGPDQETIDKFVSRGAKSARKEINESIAKKYGKGLDDLLADIDERIARDAEKEAKVEGDKEKHQREIERVKKAHQTDLEKLSTFANRLKQSALEVHVSSVLAKMAPASESAAKLLAREVRDRIAVELDDKGEIEVSYLDGKGKRSDELDAALLATELSEALPMLVTQRTGHGAGLGVTVTTPEAKTRGVPQNSAGQQVNGDDKAIKVGQRVVPVFSTADNIGALAKVLGQEK